MDLCVNQMKNVLSSRQLPENASMEVIGRAYHATETFVQVCFFQTFGGYNDTIAYSNHAIANRGNLNQPKESSC